MTDFIKRPELIDAPPIHFNSHTNAVPFDGAQDFPCCGGRFPRNECGPAIYNCRRCGRQFEASETGRRPSRCSSCGKFSSLVRRHSCPKCENKGIVANHRTTLVVAEPSGNKCESALAITNSSEAVLGTTHKETSTLPIGERDQGGFVLRHLRSCGSRMQQIFRRSKPIDRFVNEIR